MICERMFRLKKNGEPYWDCYCRHPKLIENYDKAISDETQTWEVHHKKEELYSYKELIERGEYFDVPPEELIFLTHKDHCNIDSYCRRRGEALSKKVLCIETGEVFPSTVEASRKTGIHFSNISNVCNGKRKSASGYHWRYV